MLLVASLANRFSYVYRGKGPSPFGKYWGIDIASLTDPREILHALDLRAGEEVGYWMRNPERGAFGRAQQAFLRIPRADRERLVEDAQALYLLHTFGASMVIEVEAIRVRRSQAKEARKQQVLRGEGTWDDDYRVSFVRDHFAECHAELLLHASETGRTTIEGGDFLRTPLSRWLDFVRELRLRGILQDEVPEIIEVLEAVPGWTWDFPGADLLAKLYAVGEDNDPDS